MSAVRRSSAGYTMIELVVVLTVLGILTAAAVWRMAPSLEQARVRRVAAVIATDLQYAQMLAARSRKPVVVLVNPALKMYFIRDRNGTTVFRERFLGADSDYNMHTLAVSPSNSLEVFPNGVTVTTATFTAGVNDYQRQVRFSRAGQIRILEP